MESYDGVPLEHGGRRMIMGVAWSCSSAFVYLSIHGGIQVLQQMNGRTKST